MSRKNREFTSLSDRFYEKVFKIKLKGAQEIPTNNEFMKAIEQEYAIKYLESLSIEPTKANIANILKEHPLKECKFGAGWNNSGRVADSLTIIARQKSSLHSTEGKKSSMDEDLGVDKKSTNDIKGLASKTADKNEHDQARKSKLGMEKKNLTGFKFLNNDDTGSNPKEVDNKFKLDYNIDSIKSKYLYPFNESKQKKNYQNLVDDPTTSYLPQIEKGASNDVLNSFKYYFPFSHVKVPSLILKELQVPLKITTADISAELQKFSDNFPFSSFPQQKTKAESEASVSTFQTPPDSRISDRVVASTKPKGGIYLKDVDIDKCREMLVTDEMARIVGVLIHLAYWQLFGHLNPVQPDLLTKKQMILISVEQINLLRKKVKNLKLWSLFVLPMVLLGIRMMIELIFRNHYVNFFNLEKPCIIALEKANLLISNMFDPNMLYSRFAFFESEIEAVNKKFSDHLDETRFRSKRIYGTNPYIDLYFPNPESDFVRNIRQKKQGTGKNAKKANVENDAEDDLDEVEKGDRESNENKEYLQQSYKVKMFQVLLDKIDDNAGNRYKNKSSVLNYEKEKL